MDPQIDAEFDVTDSGARIMRWLARWVAAHRREARLASEAKHLLGITGDPHVAYCHVSRHSQFTTAHLHPDNADALASISADAVRQAELDRRLTTVDDLSTSLGKSLVLIGSPTAEALSRIVFGYEPCEGDNGLVLSRPPIELPFHWQLDPREIPAEAVARRFVRGREWTDRPNWYVIESTTTGDVPHVPYVGNLDARLESDFLLVTRVRNFLTREALHRGHYILSFGGAHGTGTRALELLLKEPAILGRVAEQLRSMGHPHAFQLLFEVTRLSHRKDGTRAHAIALRSAAVIPTDANTWQQASDAVAGSVLQLQLTRE